MDKISKSIEEWRNQLNEKQFRVTREKGTEEPFTGEYTHFKEPGVYRCMCCGNELFSSETKFDSGTGWPSFWAPIEVENINTAPDHSLSKVRTEILCSKCDAHLGHVFNDGPAPTHKRYCLNSIALQFERREKKGKN